MSSQVQRISNSTSYGYRQKLPSAGSTSHANPSMMARGDRFEKTDESNDGKFSFWQATKNFGKGLISPVTSLFESKKNFIMGAGMIAAGAALVVATGGAAAPLLVGAGVAMGAVQGAKGLYKIAKAKNGDDVENAFYDLGGATSTIGLSVVGAKSSLKQAGIEADGLNMLSSTGKCLTSTKSMATESFGVFKSGYYKTNITNFYKGMKIPKELKTYSHELYQEGAANFDNSFKVLKNVLPEKFQPWLKGRNKCELSIYEKMVKEMTTTIDEGIADIKKDATYSDIEKKTKIAELLSDREKFKTSPEFAKGKIEDLYGARITLEDTRPATVQELVNSFSDAAKRGEIEILEVENYRGKNAKMVGENDFYFSKDQVKELNESSGGMSKIKFRDKPSGYTAVQLKIKVKSGQVFEVQVRGPKVNEIGELEHPPYDLSQGKDLAKGNNKVGIIFSAIEKAIKKLNPEQNAAYKKYFYEHYINAQAKELGKPYVEPVFPEGIDPVLSIESIESISNKAHGIPHGAKKSDLNIISQAPFVSGMMALLNGEDS